MSYSRSQSPFALTPWTRRLLLTGAVVYLLQVTVFTGRWFFDLFAFTPALVIEQPWTFVTYMFMHGGLAHIFFNSLMLFFFGPAVEERMGGSSFLRYYLFCGLGGAILSFAFAFNAPMIGASAAIYGVALAFAAYWPDAPIMVFPLPVPIKAKWLVGFLAVTALIYGLAGSGGGIAHHAHLGGFLFGAIWLLQARGWFGDLLSRRSQSRPAPRARVFVHPAAGAGTDAAEGSRAAARRSRWHDESAFEEVDRVLEKISKSGLESLTSDERRILDDMSRQLRDR